MLSRKLFLLFFLISSNLLFAQITLTFPYERMVFQRNNTQQGNIIIAGNYYSKIDRIEARALPRWVGSGTETAWTTIQNNPTNGYFKGNLFAQQGWYSLEIRGILNGNIVNTQTLQRVGIGEVFAIAGQSNAQGGAVNGFGSVDDRVNSVKFSNDYSSYNKLPLGFSHLDNDSQIAPFHYVPWAYGKLGDLLSAKLNVPILFYGAGHGGTSSTHWGQSAQGLPFSGPGYIQQQLGAPYRALENSVAYYASLTGLRAVLWHQGESDPDTDQNTYYNNVVNIINRSRINTEHSQLAWVVARASVNPTEHGNVIAGQNQLIQNYSQVYAGPNTDLIVGSENRSDGIHFDTYSGLIAFATAWDASLDNNFFSNSTPMFASSLLDLTVNCNPSNPSNPLSLVAPTDAGYQQYAWSNRQNTLLEAQGISNNCCTNFTFYPPSGYEAFNWQYDSTQSISANTGRFIMNIRKNSRKTLFSPLLHITSSPIPNTPTVVATATQIRPDEAVQLTANNCTNNWLVWSIGLTQNPIVLAPPATANYTAQCKSPYCLGVASAPVSVVVSTCFPNPLSLVGSVFIPEHPYQSQISIQSIQKVQSTGKINYNALQKVELLPGFESKTGSVFRAFIAGCN